MTNVVPLRDYTTDDWDAAVIAQLGDAAHNLKDIPIEELMMLVDEHDAFMILWKAHKLIEERLHQMSTHLQTRRVMRDLIENGRVS